jgi:hypothetical protein
LRSTAEADQPGARIAVARRAATALLLERSLRRASLLPAENEPAALGLLERGEAQAYAQNRDCCSASRRNSPARASSTIASRWRRWRWRCGRGAGKCACLLKANGGRATMDLHQAA